MSQAGPGDLDSRWRRAQGLLEGARDADTRRLVRRWRRQFYALVSGLFLLTGVIGFATAVVARGTDGPAAPVPRGQATLGITLLVLSIVVLVAASVWMVRSRWFRHSWHSPVRALNRDQRRLLRQQVRGELPADPARLPLARHLAEQLVGKRTPLLLLSAGQVLLQVGGALGDGTRWRWSLAGALTALLAVGALLMERDVRRARRFLDRHPASDLSAR